MKKNVVTAYVLTTLFCLLSVTACGENKESDVVNVQESATEVSTDVASTEISDEEVPLADVTYECLDEMKEAPFESGKIQIDDVVLRFDGSMSIKELYSLLSESGNYSIKAELSSNNNPSNKAEVDYIPDLSMTNDDFYYLYVLKNDKIYYTVASKSITLEDSAVEDSVIKRIFMEDEAMSSCWFAYGIPATCDGLSYDELINEYLKDYKGNVDASENKDGYLVLDQYVSISVNSPYQYENKGKTGVNNIDYRVYYDKSTGQCTSFSLYISAFHV